MDEESLRKPRLINKYRWLLVGTIILCLSSFLPGEIGDYYPKVFEVTSISNIKLPAPPPSPSVKPKPSPPVKPRLPASIKKAERRFGPIITRAASRHKVDASLVKAVIMAESRYNPQAISKMGAKGLMQLMPGTARALGVEDAFNPEHNINGGVKYLKQLLNQFGGDVKLALAAYNAGSKNVKDYNGVPPFKATRYYIKKVFEYYKYYKDNLAREVNQV